MILITTIPLRILMSGLKMTCSIGKIEEEKIENMCQNAISCGNPLYFELYCPTDLEFIDFLKKIWEVNFVPLPKKWEDIREGDIIAAYSMEDGRENGKYCGEWSLIRTSHYI